MSVAKKVYRYNDADELRLPPPSFPFPFPLSPNPVPLLLLVLLPWLLDVELLDDDHVDEGVKGGKEDVVDGAEVKTSVEIVEETDMMEQKQEL